jgi:hypothetical protein
MDNRWMLLGIERLEGMGRAIPSATLTQALLPWAQGGAALQRIFISNRDRLYA